MELEALPTKWSGARAMVHVLNLVNGMNPDCCPFSPNSLLSKTTANILCSLFALYKLLFRKPLQAIAYPSIRFCGGCYAHQYPGTMTYRHVNIT